MVDVTLAWWSEAILTQSVLSGVVSPLSAFAIGPLGCSANDCLIPDCLWTGPYNC